HLRSYAERISVQQTLRVRPSSRTSQRVAEWMLARRPRLDVDAIRPNRLPQAGATLRESVFARRYSGPRASSRRGVPLVLAVPSLFLLSLAPELRPLTCCFCQAWAYSSCASTAL